MYPVSCCCSPWIDFGSSVTPSATSHPFRCVRVQCRGPSRSAEPADHIITADRAPVRARLRRWTGPGTGVGTGGRPERVGLTDEARGPAGHALRDTRRVTRRVTPRGRTGAMTTTAVPGTSAPKELAVRWLDLISAGDVEELCRTTSPTWSMAGGPPGLPPGPDGIRALVASFGRIQQRWIIEDVIAEGDRVVVRAVNHCEQDAFLGVPAAGVEQVFAAT